MSDYAAAFKMGLDTVFTSVFANPGTYHVRDGADIALPIIVDRIDPDDLDELTGTTGARRPGWRAYVRVSDLGGHVPVSRKNQSTGGDTLTTHDGRELAVVDRDLDELHQEWRLDVDEVTP